MDTGLPMLRAVDLRKSFGANEVLCGVDLDVPRRSTVVLIGASGSGKTTLLRCLNHLETPSAGAVWLDGQTLGGGFIGTDGAWVPAPEAAIARQRTQIGFVFQRFNLFPHLSTLDNVAVGPQRVRGLSRGQARERAAEALRRVHLADHMHKRPSELSGGQQQRVAIARSLAMEPKVILFDEPTSALDPELVHEVLEVMLELAAAGMTMVVVTHEMRFAADVGTRIVFMANGTVCESGPPEQLFRDPQREETRQFLRFFSMGAR
ncbi:MAG TPA: amino acid ABC transporter ATP-binding protein [Xanthobacteraceae bacterium]|nr:amino acid ABC transporter ATP-binding protein [Xanthobacteraceae bacterium]